MLLVKTKIGQSKLHGIGLFADQLIKKDKLVWELTPGFDLIVEKEEVEKLPDAAKQQFLNYAYLAKDLGKYVLCADDARFFNHSSNPNVLDDGKNRNYAARDIKPGEELTCDYGEFDLDFDYKMTHDRYKL